MVVFRGSRYSGGGVSEIITNNTIKKKFIHLRDSLDKTQLKDNFELYIVMKNEDLDLIASKFGIDPTQWWILADINNVFFAFDIKEGDQIVIPSQSILNKL